MASDITNGLGGSVDVTETAVQYDLTPALSSSGGHKTASYVKVWNTGSYTVYALVNAETADMSTATAVPIPPFENFPFMGQPIRSLVLACASGETSTAQYGAY